MLLQEVGRVIQSVATSEDQRTIVSGNEEYTTADVMHYVEIVLCGLKVDYSIEKLETGTGDAIQIVTYY